MNTKEQFVKWLKEEIARCHTRSKAFQVTLDEILKNDSNLATPPPEPAKPAPVAPPVEALDQPLPADTSRIAPERIASALVAIGGKAFRPQRLAQLLGIPVASASQRCYRMVATGVLARVSPGEFRAVNGQQPEPELEPEPIELPLPMARMTATRDPSEAIFVSRPQSSAPLFSTYDEDLTVAQKLDKAKADLVTATSSVMVTILKDKIRKLEANLAEGKSGI